MTLIKSISGIRGTIGGARGENLTPLDVQEFICSFGQLIKTPSTQSTLVVVGRDGRITGKWIEDIVISCLIQSGINVINLGLSTTPTVEMAVLAEKADGGIVISASHNPMNWNALKFFNSRGEFISAKQGEKILSLARESNFSFASVSNLGSLRNKPGGFDYHIRKILDLDLVNKKKIRERKFHVVVDCINSTGALALPLLLNSLGCTYLLLNQSIEGRFAHNPEPLEDNLVELSQVIVSEKADMGIAVDPDVDRLAFVDEKGNYCGEEYTLVMVAERVLRMTPGVTVSNLSSTIALREITELHGQSYVASAVGEVNVVQTMKDNNAVIGGEGNGGVIYPPLHYGRDALVGIALVMSALAEENKTLSDYRNSFPDYIISKNKIELTSEMNIDSLLRKVKNAFESYPIDTTDGVKIYFTDGWAHLRRSNTEPIIRLYTEAQNKDEANKIARIIKAKVTEFLV